MSAPDPIPAISIADALQTDRPQGESPLFRAARTGAKMFNPRDCGRCRERQIASTLQTLLLPRLPVSYGPVSLAAYFRPGSDEADVGGDFYAAFPHRDGRLCLILGDVQGQGLTAAARIAELRYSLEAFAQVGLEPGESMRFLNEKIAQMSGAEFVTLIYLAIDLKNGTVDLVNAGHEPPLRYYADDRVWEPLVSLQPMLGVSEDADYADAYFTLHRGDSLLLYTDGIASVLPRSGKWSTDDLLQCARRTVLSPRGLVGEVFRSFPKGGDDAAVVALEWNGSNSN
jgi:serine phosphatase RsbU (regulator of sigma subunit)